LIDNIIVSKTFSPDLSGAFAGGNVNIVTKDFPDRFTFQWNSSLGFNDQASFNTNFLTHKGGKTDALGFEDGGRDVPASITENGVVGLGTALTDAQKAQLLAQQTKDFGEGFETERKSPFLNQFHSLSLGNQIDVLGRPFGFVSSLSYQRNFSYFDNGITGRYSKPGAGIDALNPQRELTSEKGSESTLMGANLNMAYKLSPTDKIALNLMYNHSSDKITDARQGRWSYYSFNDDYIYRTQVLQFLERSIASAQLKGKHTVGKNNIEIEWLSSLARSTQDEPDLRYFSDDYVQTGSERRYQFTIDDYAAPTRYYRDMSEINWDNKVDISIPFTTKAGESKIKVGGSYLIKDRDFNEQIYEYTNIGRNTDTYSSTGNIEDFFAESGVLPDGSIGLVIGDGTQITHSYTGYQQIIGAYAMTDWRFANKFRTVMGVRYEGTQIQAESDNPNRQKADIIANDFLPSLNLIYEATKKTNLRLSYGRTLARPTFRELAPFPTFDFAGDFQMIGNPNLERTLIDNFDARYEMYPNAGEIISVSAFYKNFQNPIERAFNPQAANGEIQFRNVASAQVMGLEFEFRKRLDFINSLKNFSVGTNLSLMTSSVDIDPRELELIRATDPDRAATRSMFMQSPYVINSFVYYDLEEKGLSISANFNVFGERLAIVTQGGQPDVFEKPRPSFDLSFKKTVAKNWSASLRARNLFNPEYQLVQEFKGQEYVYDSYTIGRTFSVGITYLID